MPGHGVSVAVMHMGMNTSAVQRIGAGFNEFKKLKVAKPTVIRQTPNKDVLQHSHEQALVHWNTENATLSLQD